MRIAVCDDQTEFLTLSKNLIQSICKKRMVKAVIKCFKNPNDLISAFDINEYAFDLVLLDICMPEMNGKVCAEKLRSKNKRFKLIFVTKHEKEVYNLFQYNISGFILKSMPKEYIERELVRVFAEIDDEKKEWLPFEILTPYGGYMKLKIPISDISYFDIDDKRIKLHTLKNAYELKYTNFVDLKEHMSNYNFVVIHRICMVNVDCIYSIMEIKFSWITVKYWKSAADR